MSEVDWDNMIDVESKVIRLQAFFRGKLTLKQLENDAMEIKRKTHPSSNIPEYTAVEYFVFSLKSRGLTPESFFRICDSTYTKSVPVEVFKNKIAELKIKLADTQIRRLVLIFDEDMEGTISLAEFQNNMQFFTRIDAIASSRCGMSASLCQRQLRRCGVRSRKDRGLAGCGSGHGSLVSPLVRAALFFPPA